MITKYVTSTLILSAFITTLLGGMLSGGSLEYIIWRALKAMVVFCGVGLIVGWAATRVVREYRTAQYAEVFGEPENAAVEVAEAADEDGIIEAQPHTPDAPPGAIRS